MSQTLTRRAPSRRSLGAPAPRPLTEWIDYLRRRKEAAKKARAAVKRRRAVTEQLVTNAERLLADVIAGADVIGLGTDPEGYPAAYLLLTLHRGVFDDLSTFGAEREDLEDTHDREPTEADEGEHDLGRCERLAQHEERGTDDAEPSLGSTGMIDQGRWHEGGSDSDVEADPCDRGKALQLTVEDEAIIEAARSRYEAAAASKVVALPARDPNGKPGAWLMHRGRGGTR